MSNTATPSPEQLEAQFVQELNLEESSAAQVKALEIGKTIYRAELISITADWQAAVSEAKTRFTRTFRSAKFRAQEIDPELDYRVDTSSTPHGDGGILVAATITRIA